MTPPEPIPSEPTVVRSPDDGLSAYPLSPTAEQLESYRRELGLSTLDETVGALGRVVARGAAEILGGQGAVVVRRGRHRGVCLFAWAKEPGVGREIGRQLRALPRGLAAFRRADWPEVEETCRRLARSLRQHLGSAGTAGSRFVAIPRGGFTVLGLLAGLLDLDPAQLSGAGSAADRVVLVDDFAFSGLRGRRFLSTLEAERVIFATLYSSPASRSALRGADPRVEACLSGADVRAAVPGESREGGSPSVVSEHLCLPWKEPDRVLGRDGTSPLRAWPLLPPESRWEDPAPAAELEVQVQSRGEGPLRPAPGVFVLERGEALWVADVGGGRMLFLEGSGAVVWRWSGRRAVDTVVDGLLDRYEADPSLVRSDVTSFLDGLVAEGLLTGEDP